LQLSPEPTWLKSVEKERAKTGVPKPLEGDPNADMKDDADDDSGDE
jgi:hypothetical protein